MPRLALFLLLLATGANARWLKCIGLARTTAVASRQHIANSMNSEVIFTHPYALWKSAIAS